MDQKLLDALNNLSEALELMAETLKEKSAAKSPTAEALKSGDFSSQIKEISVGIKSIKKDTQEILKQQKTILAISQKRENDKKTGLFDEAGDKKSADNLKKGIGTVLLIAVAVLAIGMAFKLVGKVDFFSVVSLGIAMVLMATAFEKIAKMNITLKQAFDVSKMMVIVSLAIALSSYVLKFVVPISLAQAVTAILIGAMFSAVAFGLSKMLNALGGANMLTLGKSILALPLILPAIAAGIALSSYFLKMVSPLSLAQAVTAILIAGVFTVVSFGLNKIIDSFRGVDPETLLAASVMIPIILPALALSIAVSSWALSMVKPINFGQFITALGISILFIALSFAVSLIAKYMNNIGLDDVIILPMLFVTLSSAIYLSSLILSKSAVIPNDKIFSALKIGILMAGLSIAFTPAFWLMSKLGVGIKEALTGSLVIVAIAGAIALSSVILAMGNYGNFPSLGWTLGVAASLLVFSVGAIAIGALVMSGFGAVAMLAGAAAILGVAVAVVATAEILSKGNYGVYPSFSWSMGVGASILGFSAAMIGLGALVVTGIGAVSLLAGGVAVLGIAKAIVSVANILSKGNYGIYPDLSWATGVGLLITSFGLATMALGAFIMGTLGLGGLALKKGSDAVKNIAQSIVDTAAILKKGDFTGGPTAKWAEGISMALGAFSPVYAMLMADGIMKVFGGGVGPEDFNKAIKTISDGILYSATLFIGTEGIFKGGPSKAWSEGVGTAISAFAPVYKVLTDGAIMKAFGIGGVSVESMKAAILTISYGIVDAANIFAKNTATFDAGKYPSSDWGAAVSAALMAFSPVYDAISNAGWFTSASGAVENLVDGVRAMAEAIVSVAISFSNPEVSWSIYPDSNWSAGVDAAVKSYINLNDMLVGKQYDDSVVSVARKIVKTAKIMNEGPFTNRIDPNFMKNMASNVFYFMELTKKLNETSGGLKGLIKSTLFGDPISNLASSMVKLANAYDQMSNSLTKFGKALGTIDASKVSTFKDLNNGIMQSQMGGGGGIVDSVTGAVGSVVGAAGDLVSGVFNKIGTVLGINSPQQAAATPVVAGNEDLGKKMDAVISLLVKLDKSTSSLDLYIKERMSKSDGKSATKEK